MAKKPETAGPSVSSEEALHFHAMGRPGKLEIVATKPMATQRDSSLAYSPGVAVPVKAIAEDPSQSLRLHHQGQHGRRHLQRHRHSRHGQSRRAGLEARHGRQGGAVQALRRRRRHRPRGRHRECRRVRQLRALSRPLLRRHQPRGHQGARLLHHRRAPARADGHPRLPRRPARHRHHRHGRPDQRAPPHRPRHEERKARLQRRGRRRHRLHRDRQVHGVLAREHHPLRHQGRGVPGPHRRHEPVEVSACREDRRAHAGGRP